MTYFDFSSISEDNRWRNDVCQLRKRETHHNSCLVSYEKLKDRILREEALHEEAISDNKDLVFLLRYACDHICDGACATGEKAILAMTERIRQSEKILDDADEIIPLIDEIIESKQPK